jgi:hypothetical protein
LICTQADSTFAIILSRSGRDDTDAFLSSMKAVVNELSIHKVFTIKKLAFAVTGATRVFSGVRHANDGISSGK